MPGFRLPVKHIGISGDGREGERVYNSMSRKEVEGGGGDEEVLRKKYRNGSAYGGDKVVELAWYGISGPL
ncbi:hypothetical protein Tco_1045471 [Tanacetum coccineum]|uniref:Uncharacterized protein n=1 Tax=Tanacetum coccineum TaxID=301880 RepID=A0ABQ5GU27_9ASTR